MYEKNLMTDDAVSIYLWKDKDRKYKNIKIK